MDEFMNLWSAVLELAVEDLNKKVIKSMKEPTKREIQRLRDEAKAWILAKGDHLGSFTWVCVALDMDPVRTRKLIFLNKNK